MAFTWRLWDCGQYFCMHVLDHGVVLHILAHSIAGHSEKYELQ